MPGDLTRETGIFALREKNSVRGPPGTLGHLFPVSVSVSETPLSCSFGGRYWDRTSDLFRVREARYRCANRPRDMLRSEVEKGFEPS